MGERVKARAMVCVSCGRTSPTIRRARPCDWLLWVGGSPCKRCHEQKTHAAAGEEPTR